MSVNREEIFEAWAPAGAAWSHWARPVLFAQMPPEIERLPLPTSGQPWLLLDVAWAPPADGQTLLILDLPEQESVYLGLALAHRGYRPVPLFNACTAPNELVPQVRIHRALHDGAADLRALSLPPEAPPAFLLDEMRHVPARRVEPPNFDNRWRVYIEDFPEAARMQAWGLTRAILVQRVRLPVPDDLRLILWDWQDTGFSLAVKDLASSNPPRPFVLQQPAWPVRLWEWLFHALGGRRSPKHGFGHKIVPASHG